MVNRHDESPFRTVFLSRGCGGQPWSPGRGLAAAAHAAKSVTGPVGPDWPRIAAASASAAADGGMRSLRR